MELLVLLFSAFAVWSGLCREHHVSHTRHTHNPVFRSSLSDELEHIKYHMQDAIANCNMYEMADDEETFLYFKMQDSDDNNKIDGCELAKAWLHHNEDQVLEAMTATKKPFKYFTDKVLPVILDRILESDDKNLDGFIDYREFVCAANK